VSIHQNEKTVFHILEKYSGVVFRLYGSLNAESDAPSGRTLFDRADIDKDEERYYQWKKAYRRGQPKAELDTIYFLKIRDKGKRGNVQKRERKRE
jgi:hypothetical protein